MRSDAPRWEAGASPALPRNCIRHESRRCHRARPGKARRVGKSGSQETTTCTTSISPEGGDRRLEDGRGPQAPLSVLFCMRVRLTKTRDGRSKARQSLNANPDNSATPADRAVLRPEHGANPWLSRNCNRIRKSTKPPEKHSGKARRVGYAGSQETVRRHFRTLPARHRR
jgi:hypothetical protein